VNLVSKEFGERMRQRAQRVGKAGGEVRWRIELTFFQRSRGFVREDKMREE
jgi:hypothetical protein